MMLEKDKKFLKYFREDARRYAKSMHFEAELKKDSEVLEFVDELEIAVNGFCNDLSEMDLNYLLLVDGCDITETRDKWIKINECINTIDAMAKAKADANGDYMMVYFTRDMLHYVELVEKMLGGYVKW